MKDKEFTIDDQIAILKAYKEGKTIQVLDFSKNWIDIELDNYGFDFASNVYRIKLESKYRPYKSSEEVLEDIKEKGFIVKSKYLVDRCYLIIQFDNNRIWTAKWDENYQKTFESFTWSDGTPFGRKEDCDE